MSRIRREKRELERLSRKPNYIKRYNGNVRKHNEKARNQRKKDKMFEYLTFFVVISVLISVISYKLWQKG